MYLIPGIIGFLAMYLFDVNKLKWHSKVCNLFFAGGMLLVMLSTLYGILQCDFSRFENGLITSDMILLVCLILSGLALLYTLFFALPFDSTYMQSEGIPLVNKGAYGVCRHPGFWMLILFYLFLYFFFQTKELFAGFLVYTVCNFIYVYIQDNYVFPLYIAGYDDYKKSVPFLLPTKDSIKNAFRQK